VTAGGGQGPSLSAAERAVAERHAMEAATRHFQNNGCTTEDVPAALLYGRLCRHEGRMPRRVEAGATGGASAVILTRNEVLAARAEPAAAPAAIVHGITPARSRAKATGGGIENN